MTESEIQRAVFNELKSRAMPGALYWHTPNDPSSRRKVGYRAGVSDVVAVHGGEFFALELKIEKGGVISDEQMEFRAAVRRAGGHAEIAEGLDEALCFLEKWNILRPEAA